MFGGRQSHVGSSKYHHLDSCTQALPVGSWIARVSLANKACVTLPGRLFIIKEKGEKRGKAVLKHLWKTSNFLSD